MFWQFPNPNLLSQLVEGVGAVINFAAVDLFSFDSTNAANI
jgi:hypothetical protein